MKKQVILFIFFIVFCINSIAQTDSIRNEILNAQNSTAVLIVKGRNLLKDKFIEGDFRKVAEIEDFLLNKLPNSEYIPLFPEESWLIKYWTKDYSGIIKCINQYDSVNHELNRKTNLTDNLYFELYKKSYLFKAYLMNTINEASISQHDKDFLLMHLKYCLLSKNSKEITQDTLNNLADNFLAKYPNTFLKDFTRLHIRYKYSVSEFAWGYGLFSGYGIFTGELSKSFTNNIPIGFDVDFQYNNIMFLLRLHVGIGKTKRDFNDKGVVWEKNSQVNTLIPEFAVGYKVMQYRRLNFSPFIGIASTNIGPTEYDTKKIPDLEKYELSFTTTFNIGINVDVNFGKTFKNKIYYDPLYFNGFLRIRYSYYMPQFSKNYQGFGGNLHSITIGYGGIFRSIRRKY